MTVSSEVARVVHTANGTATFFSYAPMDGVTPGNLKVYLFDPTTGALTLQTLGTDYTFGSGGVTFTAAPPSGRRVILLRQVELLQPDVYKTNAPFPAAVTEKRLDEIVKGLQQINDVVQNRSIILPPGDAGFSSNVLPAVENRKGGVLYFNATTGDPEAKQLADTIVAVSPWAMSFLTQSTAAAGLSSIGAVAKAGDTMTGLLTLSGAPTATLHAATKGYVDTEVGTRVAKAGDTMTGPLTLPGAPTAANHAATKAYVDTEVDARVAKSGDTMTGFLTLHADPTAAMHAVTRQYVDRGTAGPVTASGSAVDFTGIPVWANQVRVIGMSVAATTAVLPRLRVGGTSILTTGYTSAGTSTAVAVASLSSTTEFLLAGQDVTTTCHFVLTLIKNPNSNIWLFQSNGSIAEPGTIRGTGWINVGAALQQLRIFVPSGSFSSGNIWVEWRR